MSANNHDGADRSAGEPMLIVFGRDEKGRAHASVFDGAAAELAERAAGLMKMKALRVSTAELHAAASQLPAGRIFSSGRAFVPFCKEGVHKVLEGFGEAFQPAPPDSEQQANPQATHVPANWSDIKPGSLALAATDVDEPWYPAIVAEARDDDLFLLRWRDWPDYEGFVRRRDHLSLLCPAAAAL